MHKNILHIKKELGEREDTQRQEGQKKRQAWKMKLVMKQATKLTQEDRAIKTWGQRKQNKQTDK